MATLVIKSAVVTINAVDLSDHVKEARVTCDVDLQDETVMSCNTKKNIAGLKDGSIEIVFTQDFAAGKVDATLWPLVGAAAFPVAVRATSAAKSGTNPSYEQSVVLQSYSPIGAAVGELGVVTVPFAPAGDLARVVA